MKKVSSVVWQFFDRLEENNRCVAVLCKLCDSEYKYFGNTTNLRSHLSKKHPVQWELRQENWEGKVLDNSTFEDDENTNQSTIPKRRKYSRAHKDKNVDVLENSDIEIDHGDLEDDEATLNLVRQMHDAQGSDEEWLEEDYTGSSEIYSPKPKKVYRKIKREVVSPPSKRSSNYTVHPTPKKQIIIDGIPKKDEYSVFGEYISNKLRKFKEPRTRGNIQQLITTILWQAEYGAYDDADTVKRMLVLSVENMSQATATTPDVSQPETTDTQSETNEDRNE